MGKTEKAGLKFNTGLTIAALLLIGAAFVKFWLVGYDMDEQYEYAMAYRMLKGDFIVKEMWEPHQTSAVFEFLLMYLYSRVFGLNGVVIFSRAVGMVIHSVLMVFLYKFLKKRVSKTIALSVTGIIALTVPKLMFTPDYSNLLMWFLLIYILALTKYYSDEGRNKIYMVLAGLALMLGVFSYPALLILVPVTVYIAVRLRKNIKDLLMEAICCALPGITGLTAFLIFLRSRMSFPEIKQNIGFLLSDGSHSAGIGVRMKEHLVSLETVLVFLLIYASVSFLLFFILKNKLRLTPVNFILVMTGVSYAGQFVVWIALDRYIHFPRVDVLFAAFYLLFYGAFRKKNRQETADYLLYTLVPVASYIGVCLFTNHPFLASTPFLSYSLIGLALNIKENKEKKEKDVVKIAAWTALFIVIVGNLFLIRTAGSIKHTIFDPVSMIRKGPATGIIADDKIVQRNKDDFEMMTEMIPKGSKVLYIGKDSDVYMFNDYEVCTPSTISTPTYAENLDDYVANNPDKVPEYIVYENDYIYTATGKYGNEYTEFASNWYIHLMKKNE